MTLPLYSRIYGIVLAEFPDIVVEANIVFLSSGIPTKLRIDLADDTFIDIYLSDSGRYSYHWEQRNVRNMIHRHDNAPHPKWNHLRTFPKHFHNGSEENVIESHLSENPEDAIREFLNFVKNEIKKHLE